MFRYRTLFSRILAVCLGVLLLSVLLMNAILMVQLRRQAVGELVSRFGDGCALIRRPFRSTTRRAAPTRRF